MGVQGSVPDETIQLTDKETGKVANKTKFYHLPVTLTEVTQANEHQYRTMVLWMMMQIEFFYMTKIGQTTQNKIRCYMMGAGLRLILETIASMRIEDNNIDLIMI